MLVEAIKPRDEWVSRLSHVRVARAERVARFFDQLNGVIPVDPERFCSPEGPWWMGPDRGHPLVQRMESGSRADDALSSLLLMPVEELHTALDDLYDMLLVRFEVFDSGILAVSLDEDDDLDHLAASM